MIIYHSTVVRPYVYMGIHKITGQIYIGYREANTVPSDLDLFIYRTSSTIVRPAFDEYDWSIVAEFFNGDDAYDFEQKLIYEHWDNPLLLNKNCHYLKKRFKTPKTRTFTATHRKNISIGNKGKIRTPETIKKLSLSHSNQSAETISKISNTLKGREPWNKGIKTGPQSEAQRKVTSDALKGKPSPLKGRPSCRKGRTFLPNGPQKKITCPHCGKEGGPGAMVRFHFNNCKTNQADTI